MIREAPSCPLYNTPPSGTEAGAGLVKDHVAVADELFCVREECKKVLCIKRRRWSISFCGRSGPGGGATGGTCVDSILWATIHHYRSIHYPARMTMENLQQAQEWPSAGWPVNTWSSGNAKVNFVSTVGALRRPLTNDGHPIPSIQPSHHFFSLHCAESHKKTCERNTAGQLARGGIRRRRQWHQDLLIYGCYNRL